MIQFKTLAEIDAHLEKGTAAWYQAAYLICTYDPGTEARVLAAAKHVLAFKESLYMPVERARGVPWAMIGMIHSLECGNNPKGVLHNGELIIGTGRKTKLVPAGRGPFNDWLTAALDAIDIQSLWHVPNWSVGYILRQCELFNGSGYLKHHHAENSPYLWACTNINDGTGKYTGDGHYDPNANANGQVGAAAVLKKLEQMVEFKVQYA